MNIFEKISVIVENAFEEAGYDKSLGMITLSNRPDLCDFQCNGAMAGAKKYKKSPLSIAEDIQKFLDSDNFEKVDVVPPGFINITVSNKLLERFVNEKTSFREFVRDDQDETIIIDYGGPNVAKPLHVGHVRSAIIGESIKRCGRYLGNKVIGDVHHGDWGLQMGLVIAEIQERMPELDYFKDDYMPSDKDTSPVTIHQLNEIYPTASQKSKVNKEFLNKAYEATGKLQNKDVGYYELWKHFVEISINDMKNSYTKLNVNFELWKGESDADDYIQPLIDILKEKGLMYESQGAMIVDIQKEDDKTDIPPVIIVKSDGSQLYSTTDLATIIQREKDYKPNQILYVVDNRQSLHFTQVFRCAKLANLVDEETNLEFVGFGTMNGKDGKPYKTRDGGVMKLQDLIQTMTNEALKKVEENSRTFTEFSEEEKLVIAEKIGIAALKFGDLYNHRSRDYIFDIDKFVQFEGKTGPYLLYNVARINSILKNIIEKESVNIDDISYADIKIYSDSEKEILLKILMSETLLVKAFEEKAPNFICEHVYDIVSLFSKFYNNNKIIGENDKLKQKSWIATILLVKDTVTQLLDILAIETVERM